MKESLFHEVGMFLLASGYTVKRLAKSCFDLVARKDTKILLVKLLEDANAISRDYADELRRVSSYFSGVPLIIAHKAGDSLTDSVVYSRFGISTLNPVTFKNCVKNKLPFVKSTQAGLAASLIGRRLRELREQEGTSLAALSREIGVTPRMISKYEKDVSEITISKALKMYDVFGGGIFEKIDVFAVSTKLRTSDDTVSHKYTELGFNAMWTKRSPFDIIARRDSEIILTEVGDQHNPESRSLSRLVDADNLVIFKSKRPKDVPSVKREDFLELEEGRELIKLVKEF